jgi:hypothetical protein
VAFTNFSVFNVDEDFFLQEMGRQTLPFAPQVPISEATELVELKQICLYICDCDE